MMLYELDPIELERLGVRPHPSSLVTLRLRRPGSEEDRFKTPGLRYLDAHTWVGENERACESCGQPTFTRGFGAAVHLREILEDGTPGPFRLAGGVDRHVCHDCLTMATGFKLEVAHA